MPGRKKEDNDADADFIEVNPYGDMICSVIFLAEIAALLWHAQVPLAITEHAKVNPTNVNTHR